MTFHGIFPACVTPFIDGKASPDAMQANISRWLGTGVHGVLIFGSTGEFMYLEDDERRTLLRAAREATPAHVQFLAGCGAETTGRTIRYLHESAEDGAQAGLVVTPVYYTRGKTDAQRRYFEDVADASPIPVLIYNVPLFTDYELPVEVIADLSRHPNIIGIKDSSGNAARVAAEVRLAANNFDVFSGNPNLAFPSLSVGAIGGIYAFGNIIPEIFVAMYDAVQAADLKRAAALQSVVAALFAEIGAMGIPAIKTILKHRGFTPGIPRPPLQPLAPEVEARVISAFEKVTAEAIPYLVGD
ncbi:MAG: dihydrodipicolinate synthase family protein [Caldilineales bacterium]|nr:dihydrodipicolinate synthase family protein [Caldilineales bacterium]